MGRVTSVKPHLSEYEISERLKGTSGRVHRRWLVVWNALVDPRTVRQIARHTGVSVSSVHNLVSNYNRFGPEAVEGSKESKRRRCYFSRAQESEFLAPFLDEAIVGQICVAGRLKLALEDYLGHGVHHSTVYRMLERNQWRKVVPRPVHPQANEQTQEDFKKSPELVAQIVEERDPTDSRPVVIMGQDEGRFGRISYLRTCWAPKGVRNERIREIFSHSRCDNHESEGDEPKGHSNGSELELFAHAIVEDSGFAVNAVNPPILESQLSEAVAQDFSASLPEEVLGWNDLLQESFCILADRNTDTGMSKEEAEQLAIEQVKKSDAFLKWNK